MTYMNRTLKAIDLFSGCGGLTLGLRQADFKVVAAVEIDPYAVGTYKLNHPEVTVFEGDIRNLTFREIKSKLNIRKGDIDLVAGCPPCQGFSSIRTFNGKREIEDERNDLIFEFYRIVEMFRPKAIMMENVPGLAVDSRFKLLCSKLRKIGYTLNYDILNVAYYGVPQRRRRLILLGGLYGKINFSEKDEHLKTVKVSIAGLPEPGQSGDVLHDLPENRTEKIKRKIRSIPKNGGSRTDLPKKEQLACHKKCSGFKDVYGRMSWDEVSPTITSGCTNPSKGRFIHPEQDRAITLREAALLQSFPPTYQFDVTAGKGRVSLMIGNALPPEFIKRHAAMISSYLNIKRA
jgi:DNA (cytosine-5)-methyltransferase 1